MNIERVLSACAALTLAVVQLGCTGLHGVRYHDGPGADLCESCGVGDPSLAHGGDAATIEDAASAPHSRFHPVPTRPVFESNVVEASAVRHSPTRATSDESGKRETSADEPAAQVAQSKAPSVLASSLLEQLQDANSLDEDSAQPSTTSRRQAESVIEPESSNDEHAEEDAPPVFQPAESKPVSTDDMWRPRVGN